MTVIEKWWRSIPATAAIVLLAAAAAFGNRAPQAGAAGPSKASTEQRVVKFDTPDVRLEGRLLEREYFGPPGFGETPKEDAREKVLVVALEQPITAKPIQDAEAKGSPSLDTRKNVREVHLFLLTTELKQETRKLIGKKVIAIGTLNEAVAPSEHLEISMRVA